MKIRPLHVDDRNTIDSNPLTFSATHDVTVISASPSHLPERSAMPAANTVIPGTMQPPLSEKGPGVSLPSNPRPRSKKDATLPPFHLLGPPDPRTLPPKREVAPSGPMQHILHSAGYLSQKGFTTMLLYLQKFDLLGRYPVFLLPPEKPFLQIVQHILKSEDPGLLRRYILCYALMEQPTFNGRDARTASPGLSLCSFKQEGTNKFFIANVKVLGQPTRTSDGLLYGLREVLPFFQCTNSNLFTKVQKLDGLFLPSPQLEHFGNFNNANQIRASLLLEQTDGRIRTIPDAFVEGKNKIHSIPSTMVLEKGSLRFSKLKFAAKPDGQTPLLSSRYRVVFYLYSSTYRHNLCSVVVPKEHYFHLLPDCRKEALIKLGDQGKIWHQQRDSFLKNRARNSHSKRRRRRASTSNSKRSKSSAPDLQAVYEKMVTSSAKMQLGNLPFQSFYYSESLNLISERVRAVAAFAAPKKINRVIKLLKDLQEELESAKSRRDRLLAQSQSSGASATSSDGWTGSDGAGFSSDLSDPGASDFSDLSDYASD